MLKIIRILSFITLFTLLTGCAVGIAYAQNGNIKPVANQTYIVTPYNVGFVGDEFVGELENNGLIM